MSTKGQLAGACFGGTGLGLHALAVAPALATPPELAALAALAAMAPPELQLAYAVALAAFGATGRTVVLAGIGALVACTGSFGATGRIVVLAGIGALVATTGYFGATGRTVVLQGVATIPKLLL